jgi:hypothetical protein
LQGATSSVQSVSQLVGPFLFTLTFAYFIGTDAPVKLPGGPFFLALVLLLLALRIALRTLAGKCNQYTPSWPGLVPAIHVLLLAAKTWMPGTRPGMTSERTSYFFTSGHSLASSGLAASSGEIVAISL